MSTRSTPRSLLNFDSEAEDLLLRDLETPNERRFGGLEQPVPKSSLVSFPSLDLPSPMSAKRPRKERNRLLSQATSSQSNILNTPNSSSLIGGRFSPLFATPMRESSIVPNQFATPNVSPWPSATPSKSLQNSSRKNLSSSLTSLNQSMTQQTNSNDPTMPLSSASIYKGAGSQVENYSHVIDYLQYDASEERRNGADDMIHRQLLPTAFMQTLQASDDSFVRARLFAELCDKRALEVTPSARSRAAALPSASERRRMEHAGLLRDERNTWLLLEWLFADRRDAAERRHRAAVEGIADESEPPQSLSRADVLAAALQRDDQLRELALLVRWLERTHDAAVAPPAPLLATQRETCAREASNAVQARDDTRAAELHLDVAWSTLEASDAVDERALCKELWRLVRGGRIDAAQRACRAAGQPWRAAALSGGTLSDDARRRGAVAADVWPLAGNRVRLAWKMSCWAIASQSDGDTHERATFAALCGSLRGLLPAARGWEDYLWAHLKAALEWRADDALASMPDSDDDGGVDMRVDEYARRRAAHEPAPPRSVTDALALLSHANAPQEVRQGGERAFHRIQALILRCAVPDELLVELARLLSSPTHAQQQAADEGGMSFESNAVPNSPSNSTTPQHAPLPLTPQLLRFGAHVALFFNSNGLTLPDPNEDAATSGAVAAQRLVRQYAEHLSSVDNVPLLAQYAALLPDSADGIALYARHLAKLDDDDTPRRQEALAHAEAAGIDVSAVTRAIVRHTERAAAHALDEQSDAARVSAIGWLCHDPLQRGEALRQANYTMRRFIVEGKLAQCHVVVSKVLPSDLEQIVNQLGPAAVAAYDEQRQLCDYLNAMKAFDEWVQHTSLRPVPPQPPILDSYAAEVAYSRQKQQYEERMEGWQAQSDALLDVAQTQALSVLTAPGGWLPNGEQEAEEEEEKNATVSRAVVRRAALPSLLLALQRALLAAERSGDALALACLAADDNTGLLSSLGARELDALLRTARLASIACVGAGLDAFGYDWRFP